MKKIKYLLVVLMISLCLVGCDSKKEETKEENTVSANQENINDEEVVLPRTVNFVMSDMQVDVPALKELEAGVTRVYWQEDVKFIGITYDIIDKIEFSENAFDLLFPLFQDGINKFYSVHSLSDYKQESVTINGINMYRVEGILKHGVEDVQLYDARFVGYYFPINDDNTAMIIGVETGYEPSDDVYSELLAIVEKMARTVRSK